MSENKTIIHTEAANGWGGQEIRTYTESLWFKSQGWKVILLAKKDSPIWKKFQESGMETRHVPFLKKTQLGDLKTCVDIFKEVKPLMVGTHSNIDTRVALMAASIAKIEHRIRYRHVSIPVKPKLWNKLIYRKLATNIITTGDCISKPLIANLKLDPNKVITIPTGIVPPESLHDREEARKNLCKELDLPDTTRFIGQVSVLRRWKGQADVMEGFDQCADQFQDHHLVFIGGGHGEEYLPPIAKQKKHSDRIHFLGHKLDPWPYFRALDINFLASTEGEGIPQVGMQSMLSETAFVGTKIGGIPEIVTHMETGLLVDSKSPDQIQQAICTLLENPTLKSELEHNAYDWAKRNTTIDLLGQRVLNVMNQE